MRIIIVTVASLAFAGSAIAAVSATPFKRPAPTEVGHQVKLAGGVSFGGVAPRERAPPTKNNKNKKEMPGVGRRS